MRRASPWHTTTSTPPDTLATISTGCRMYIYDFTRFNKTYNFQVVGNNTNKQGSNKSINIITTVAGAAGGSVAGPRGEVG